MRFIAPKPHQMNTDKATKQAWGALWILFGINLMNFYDRQILGPVAEMVRKEWTLSDTQLGTLSTAFILMYAIVGLPLGRLADTWVCTMRCTSYRYCAWSWHWYYLQLHEQYPVIWKK